MASRDVSEFINQFLNDFTFESITWRYKDRYFFTDGIVNYSAEDGTYRFSIEEMNASFSEVVKPAPLMEYTGNSGEECLRAFEEARIWDGRSFLEAADEMEFVW